MHKDACDGSIHFLFHLAFRCSVVVADVLFPKPLAERNTIALPKFVVGRFMEDRGAYEVECEGNRSNDDNKKGILNLCEKLKKKA